MPDHKLEDRVGKGKRGVQDFGSNIVIGREKPTGSPGYTPPSFRQERSGFDPSSLPSGGRITETSPRNERGIQTVVTTDFDDDTNKKPSAATDDNDNQDTSTSESLNNFFDNFTIMGRAAPIVNEFLDKLVSKNIDKSTLSDPNKLAILEARIRRGDFGKGTKTLEQELFDKDGEYFDLVNEIFADDLKDKENIEKYGKDVTPEEILRGNLKKAGLAADPNITFRFDEEAAKEKFKNMPATNRDKVDLASLPTTGPNAIEDPELRKKIFDARAELNRDDRNPFTGVKNDGGIPSVNVDEGGGGGDESTDDNDPDQQFYGYNLGPAEITYPGSESVFVDPSQGPLQSLFVNNYQGNPNNVGIATAADGMFVDKEPSLPLKLQDIKYEKRTNMMRNMDRIQPETNVMQGNMDLAPNLNRGI